MLVSLLTLILSLVLGVSEACKPFNAVQDSDGNPPSWLAVLTADQADVTTKATIYSSPSCTTGKTNPVAKGATVRSFCAKDDVYDLLFSPSNIQFTQFYGEPPIGDGRGTVVVKGIADGIADDTAEIKRAIILAGVNGDVIFPPGTYKVTSPLTQLTSQRWHGLGGQRATTLKKYFNGDLITMGSLGEIANLNLENQGGTYSGKGIVISLRSGFSQKITRVRIQDSADAGIFFAEDAGSGAVMSEIEGYTISPLTVSMIQTKGDSGTTGVPRFLRNSWLAGGVVDISGSETFTIAGAYLNHVKTDSASTSYKISGTRWALAGNPVSIQGVNGHFSDNQFAGVVTLKNSQGLFFSITNEFGFGVTEDPATTRFNSLYTFQTRYTPTWTNASGTQPVLGNGTITGWYMRNGHMALVDIVLTMGSTTIFGNAMTGYEISLPVPASDLSFDSHIPLAAEAYDLSSATSYPLSASIGAGQSVLSLGWNGGLARLDHPFKWAHGDLLKIHLEYPTK